MGKARHGHATDAGQTPEYSTWRDMVRRCTDPRTACWKNYGGRGVSVCERWKKFDNFLADMGLRPTPRHTLDRIDNDRGYEPGNVRWATMAEQARNRRNNHRLTLRGETKCLSDWAFALGVHPTTLYQRIFVSGWTVERALSTPKGATVNTGVFKKGVRGPSTKLDEVSVAAIKRRLLAGESRSALAAEFGVGKPAIWKIAVGRSWSSVSPEVL